MEWKVKHTKWDNTINYAMTQKYHIYEDMKTKSICTKQHSS